MEKWPYVLFHKKGKGWAVLRYDSTWLEKKTENVHVCVYTQTFMSKYPDEYLYVCVYTYTYLYIWLHRKYQEENVKMVTVIVIFGN